MRYHHFDVHCYTLVSDSSHSPWKWLYDWTTNLDEGLMGTGGTGNAITNHLERVWVHGTDGAFLYK